MSAQATYNLSSLPPVGAFIGVEPVTLLVGLEDESDGALRVYLGARWKGLYIRVTEPEAQDQFRRAWGAGRHVWMWPLPDASEIYRAPSGRHCAPEGTLDPKTDPTRMRKKWRADHTDRHLPDRIRSHSYVQVSEVAR